MNRWWHTQMMAGYHRQDLLQEVEHDRLVREHQGSKRDIEVNQQEVRSAEFDGYSSSRTILIHRYAVRAAIGGIGGLIGLALLYSLY